MHLKFYIVWLFLIRFEVKEKNVKIVIGRTVGAPRMSIPRKTRMRQLTHNRTCLIVVKNVRRCVNSIDNIIVWRLQYEVITNLYFIVYYGWATPYYLKLFQVGFCISWSVISKVVIEFQCHIYSYIISHCVQDTMQSIHFPN